MPETFKNNNFKDIFIINIVFKHQLFPQIC